VQIYYRKKRWKWLLFGTAVLIIIASLWYTNILVREIARDERMNIQIWAEAIKRKADLVNYTKRFFDQIKVEERKRAEVLAMVYENLRYDTDSQTLEFYRQLMERNTTIPIILTDQKGNITTYRNIKDSEMAGVSFMSDSLKNEFSSFEPIRVNLDDRNYVLLYFKESTIYTELRMVLNDLIGSFFSEVVGNSASVPVLVTDSTRQNVIESGNIDKEKLRDPVFLAHLVSRMESENDPIIIDLPDYGQSYIFYKNSALIDQIMYYPYVMLVVVGVFLLIAYLLFSTARNAEQNLVWIGMSKETAHQLGTPLSSMIAWIELLKMKGEYHEEISEIEKDIHRLENITDRFSKIGSPPRLEPENIIGIIYESINYLRPRTSSKVKYEVNLPADQALIIPVNKHLFEWVVENLCKNSVDAMNGVGNIGITITEDENHVIIDFEDTGKGIHKSYFKTIFNPGFTSKKRGWGLGLSLSKRIIENYHNGKIFVRSSVIDKGTVIRVILKK
jgi:two-component system, sporulation sensor kinase D